MRHRIHSLGIPHTATNKDYLTCAFTQKVLKGNTMLHRLNNEVIHYGNEASDTDCAEHVTVTTTDDLKKAYGDTDFSKEFYKFDRNDHAYQTFFKNTIPALEARLQENDMILCWFGTGHLDAIRQLDPELKQKVFIVEPGIGYPYTFAPYKIYESYCRMHADIFAWSQAHEIYNDLKKRVPNLDSLFHWKRQHYTIPPWNDTVIPNYFDPNDFDYREDHDGYYFFIGRLISTKGLELAMRLAHKMGKKLIVAGQGDFVKNMGFAPWDCVQFIGTVGIEERRKWLAGAELVICASYYPEPFCGTHIEALMSGTPIVTTDWGVFPETVPHGIVGFRCRTFNYFVEAARNIHEIQPSVCRQWAENNFSLDRVSLMYQEYFDNIVRVAENPDNFWAIGDAPADLNMLRRPISPELTLESMEFIQTKNKVYADTEQRVADAVESQIQALMADADNPHELSDQILKTVMGSVRKHSKVNQG